MEGESEPAAAAAAFSAVLDDDDLLGEILLRVAFPTSLVRAALVCKRWLRLVSAPAFLRRFGDLHPPSLLGFYVVTMSFTSADGQPPRFVPVPDQPPELDAVVRRANFDVGTFGADIYVLDCWNGLLLTRQVGSRSKTVRNPLCPAAQTTILPPTPSTSIHGGGFTYHYREILPNGVGDDGRMSCFCLAIGRKGHLGQHCVLDVYALHLQDDAWAIYASAVTETSVVHLPLPSLIVDEKICNLTLVTDRYKPGSYKLFWLDLASSRFSLVNLPEEVQYYAGTGLSVANDSGGVHFIYAKGSQLRIWLYKADTDSNGLADWLHVHTVCLPEMIPTSMFGEVMVRAVGANSAFIFLEKNDVIYLLDIKHKAAKKVYQFITQEEDRFMDGVRPFMMVWPPKFPMMKEGYCDPKE